MFPLERTADGNWNSGGCTKKTSPKWVRQGGTPRVWIKYVPEEQNTEEEGQGMD
jgi:hypothetical protein